MDETAEKEVVERFYREAISGRDADACDRLLAEDFVHNGEARGREGRRGRSSTSSPPSPTSNTKSS